MKRTLITLFAACITILLQAAIFNDSIPSGKNFNKALFRLWYPDELKSVSGIVVLVPGSNGDGRGQVNDSLWQNFAVKHGFALLGCWFTDREHTDMFIESYAEASKGSGEALLNVIEKFAASSKLDGMADAPILLWGHSAGGQFNYEFVNWKPDRVLAFIVNKGGIYFTALASKGARMVPGLLFTGEKDMESRKDIIRGLFSLNRRAGALWAFSPEPMAAHEIGQTQTMALVFFDEVVKLRLVKGSLNMLSVSAESGYLGDFKNKIIYPASEKRDTDYPLSWLPSHRAAESWLNFISGKPF